MARIVQLTRGQLRGLIAEEARRLVETPKKKALGGKKKQTSDPMSRFTGPELDAVIRDRARAYASPVVDDDDANDERMADQLHQAIQDSGRLDDLIDEALGAGTSPDEVATYVLDALQEEFGDDPSWDRVAEELVDVIESRM